MAVRKLAESPYYLESLGLKRETLRILKKAGVNAHELVAKARNDTVLQAYYYTSDAPRANQLKQYPGIGEARSKEIIEAVDKAGFILHESEESYRVRQLLVDVQDTPATLLEHYEELEDITPEVLQFVEKLICDALSTQQCQVIRLLYGFEDDHVHSTQECADALDIATGRVRALRFRALCKLGSCRPNTQLEVATCYGHESLARRALALRTSIDRLQRELDAILDFSPNAMPIEDLDFSVRTYNCLKRSGINTLGSLCEFTENGLLVIRKLGVREVEEIRERLQGMCLTLAS